MKLSNRTVLITGGTSGIGFALAKQLVTRGNTVIICGRNQQKLDQVKEQLHEIEIVRCDINESSDLNDLASFLAGRYPSLDILVNNAGIQQELDLTTGQSIAHAIEMEINTNLSSQIKITHQLYPLLSANPNSAIVFIGSALAFVPKYSAPIYSAAKAGLHSFACSLRNQAVDDGIQIIEIFPDVVDTSMTSHRQLEKRMNADEFASQAIRKLTDGSREIYIGRTSLLKLLQRCAPALALRAINKPEIR